MQTSGRNRATSWPYPRPRIESELRGRAAAFFRARGYPVRKKYPFILADWEQWPSNIILGNVAAYIRRERERRAEQGSGFPLHHYLHHGLSSQAMLFNLVGPLVLENDFEPIRSVLAAKGAAWGGDAVSAHFEIEDRTVFNEAYGQPTSVDLVVSDGSSPDLFVRSQVLSSGSLRMLVFKRGDCDAANPAVRFSLFYCITSAAPIGRCFRVTVSSPRRGRRARFVPCPSITSFSAKCSLPCTGTACSSFCTTSEIPPSVAEAPTGTGASFPFSLRCFLRRFVPASLPSAYRKSFRRS